MVVSKNLCIIPARGGSKRIPRKNIKEFCGKPIIAWPIEVAIKSGLFQRVIVSTDDYEIAEIAKRYGAEIPFYRPSNISDDFTPVREVVKHGIKFVQSEGFNPEWTCLLYATSPFVTVDQLVRSKELAIQNKKKFALAVAKYPHPVHRALLKTESHGLKRLFDSNGSTRSQDLPEAFHDAGQFLWGKSESFLKKEKVFSELGYPYVMPKYATQDIDDEEDWEFAEKLFKLQMII